MASHVWLRSPVSTLTCAVPASAIILLTAALSEPPEVPQHHQSAPKSSAERTASQHVQAGAALFLLGCYCSAIEAANTDFRYQVQRWAQGDRDDKPALDLSPIPTRVDSEFISYYGTYSQVRCWPLCVHCPIVALAADSKNPQCSVHPVAHIVLLDARFMAGSGGKTWRCFLHLTRHFCDAAFRTVSHLG